MLWVGEEVVFIYEGLEFGIVRGLFRDGTCVEVIF